MLEEAGEDGDADMVLIAVFIFIFETSDGC